MEIEGSLDVVVKNSSKALATNINLYFSIANRQYLSVEPIVDGNPRPGVKKDKFDNLFLRFRIKELKRGEEAVLFSNFLLDTKPISREDLLYVSVRKALKRKIYLVFPEGLGRIRRIAERLFFKSKLLMDFEEEIAGFIERNFGISGEKNEEGLEGLLRDNVGDIETITDFIVAVHKNVSILARKVKGLMFPEGRKDPIEHYWIEVNVKGAWVPVDIVNRKFGRIDERYLAIKVIPKLGESGEVKATYNLSKKYLKRALTIGFDRMYRKKN